MRYILDASVALKWVLPESDSPIALRIRSEFESGVHELVAPDVFAAECGHALCRAERRGILPQGGATIQLTDILTTLPALYPTLPLLTRASEIASHQRIGF